MVESFVSERKTKPAKRQTEISKESFFKVKDIATTSKQSLKYHQILQKIELLPQKEKVNNKIEIFQNRIDKNKSKKPKHRKG